MPRPTGGDLASVHSKEEFNEINALSNTDVWIGVEDQTKEGVWMNVDGTKPWTNWNRGEPNNVVSQGSPEGEDCAHLWSNGMWNDHQCDNFLADFVCEMPPPVIQEGQPISIR